MFNMIYILDFLNIQGGHLMKPKPNTPQGASLKKRLDWITTIIPFICIVILCFLFMAFPQGSTSILESVRFFLGDQLGSYYLVIGLGALICSFYMAFSRYGKIKLGSWKNPSTLPSSGAP